MMQDLELRHLAALAAVADEGSFARAAATLGFSQSAISQQIAALEKAIGLAVFDRPGGPRPAELTPAGELLLEHARSMLARVDVVADELDRLRRGITGRIVIGTFQSVSAQILPGVVGRIRAELPEVDIGLFENDDQDILIDRILADELDLTFSVDVDDPRIESTVLGFDPFVVIAAVGDLTGPHARPEDLIDHPIIGQPPTNVCQSIIDRRLADLGVRPDYVFRSVDNGAVQGMVRSGMGRAVMPPLAVDESDPGIVVLPLVPSIAPRTIQLSRRRDRTLPPAADRFTAIAQAVARGRLSPP